MLHSDYVCKSKRYDLIVLDLDNTLVHSSLDNNGSGIPLNIETDTGEFKKYWTHKRPGFDLFLETCFKFSNVGVWSTGSKDYVDKIVSLFPARPKFTFSREHCEIVQGKRTKPLDEIPFGGKTIMIDDRSDVLTDRDYVDTLVIPPWYSHINNDRILYTILPLLFNDSPVDNYKDDNDDISFQWVNPSVDHSDVS